MAFCAVSFGADSAAIGCQRSLNESNSIGDRDLASVGRIFVQEGVNDGLYAIRHVLGKGWLIWYWTATVLFIALLSAGLVWLATVDGWHHLVWIPYVAYLTLYARPNLSLIDVIWSFIVAVPFAVVASLLAWRVDFVPAMAGIPCLVWGGSRLFYYAERIRRRLASDPVLFKAMSDTDMIIWMKTG